MQQDDIEVNPASHRPPREYVRTPVVRDDHAEGTLTRLIEHQTAKLPSDFFLFTAMGAMAASTFLELTGNPRLGRVIGLWPPVLLMMGTYNKLVKVLGTR
jgi:hypothetical protein